MTGLQKVLLVLVVGVFQGASAGIQPMVKGGEHVEPGSLVASHTVAIGTESRAHCSASIIAEDLLLTAAHCVPGRNSNIPSVTTIYFGVDVDNPEATREISSYESHPDYSLATSKFSEDLNDIAVVHFKGGLPSGFEPVPVPREFDLGEGDDAILAGYGVDNQRDFGNLKMIERTVSIAEFGETEVLFEQTETEGACNGDSGGPAFKVTSGGLELVGVANRVGNHQCGEFVIYAKPQAHWDWLLETIIDIRQEAPVFVAQ